MMEKAIRKLICNSIKLRTSTSLSKYMTIHSSVATEQDILTIKKLNNYKKNIDELINLNAYDNHISFAQNIETNFKHTKAKEISKIIDDLQELLKPKLDINDIKNSKEFIKICELIQKNVRFLSLGCVIQILKILINLQVPVYTELVQTLLQILRTSINNLSIEQIETVYYVLRNQDKTSLVKALHEALPFAFRNQVQIKVNRNNSYTLFKALVIACNFNDTKTIIYIINVLRTKLNFPNAKFIVTTFHALSLLPKLNESSMIILSDVKKAIIINNKLLTFMDISFLLKIIISKFKARQLDFYDNEVINALCMGAVEKNINFFYGLRILCKLNALQFSNVPFLDYLVNECIKQMDLLTNCKNYYIFNFVKAFTFVDYKPQCWCTIQEVIVNHLITTNFQIVYLIQTTYNLISLGCYHPKLLEKVFVSYYSEHNDIKNTIVLSCILKLHYALQYLYPEYDGITFSQDRIDELIPLINYKPSRICLHENLSEIIGGSRYVKAGLKTKLGYFIDYVIVLESDGSPMVTDNVIFIEDLVLPPKCYKLLILILPSVAYSHNFQQLLSSWKLWLKVLEASTGSTVISINSFSLIKLSKHEQRELLKETITTVSNKMLNCINA